MKEHTAFYQKITHKVKFKDIKTRFDNFVLKCLINIQIIIKS
jgi:hypothetical protein